MARYFFTQDFVARYFFTQDFVARYFFTQDFLARYFFTQDFVAIIFFYTTIYNSAVIYRNVNILDSILDSRNPRTICSHTPLGHKCYSTFDTVPVYLVPPITSTIGNDTEIVSFDSMHSILDFFFISLVSSFALRLTDLLGPRRGDTGSGLWLGSAYVCSIGVGGETPRPFSRGFSKNFKIAHF